MERVESLRTENKFKKTEIGEIPVDWEVVKVQDVCEKAEYGYTESATEKLVGPKFLRISDIQNGNVNWESVPFCHCPNLIREKYLLKPEDILFARTGATTGKSCIIKRCPEAVFASYLIRIVTKERINSYFLYLVFNSFIYWKQIKEQIGGSAQGGVNASSLSNIKVPLPPLPEQKKIAEILLSVDEAIDKKQEIIEKTKMLKKGLMQELLTHGIGHKKFKKTEIGKIPLDWEVVKLEDCAARQKYSFVDGPFGSNLKSIHYIDEGIPVIQSQFIISGKFRDVETFYISAQKARELVRSKVLPGDIVIAKIGMNYGASATVPENYPEAVLSGNTMKITPNDNKVVPRFLQYLLHYLRMSKAFDQIVSTTAQPAITLKGVKNLKVPLPVIKEQKKIAEILTSVDEEIEKEMAQKEKIEKIKKGLIQVLLTGKIRVKI